ncbi:MAG: hypothetical protein AAGL24_10115 [Pseudomonadota bacterium]
MTVEVTLSDVIGLGGLLLALLGAVFGLFWRFSSEIRRIEAEHHRFQVHVAQTYLSAEAIHEIRAEFGEDIRSLRDRFDALFREILRDRHSDGHHHPPSRSS